MAYLDSLIGNDIGTRVFPVTFWAFKVFVHPLAKFPGPILWRASRLPYMRAAWGKHFPCDIQRLHAKYGDVVRVTPNELSFMYPAAWDDIYSNTDGANTGAFKKSEVWHGNPDGGPASVFNTIDLKEHARIRRFMDPAFSERAVLQQEPIIRGKLHVFDSHQTLRRMSKEDRVTVNIVGWFNFTLFDIIGDLLFGESFSCLKKCEYEGWMDQMAASIKLHCLSINLRWYPIMNNLSKHVAGFLVPEEIIKQHLDYGQRSTVKMKRRLSSDAAIDRPNIVSQLLKSEDRGEGLTEDEIVLNCMRFINAASETIATALTGLVNLLLQDPESLSTLQAGI